MAFDLATTPLREVNTALHAPGLSGDFVIAHPDGAHNVAVGLNAPIRVRIAGHVGYYAAGMNQQADVTINGNAGTGVAENMMSGTVWVKGSASQSAGATAHGGLLVIEGKAAARCGISMKGVDIVVGGDVGHMSAFMAQAGRLVVRGDAGEALGDSIYEARIYVRGDRRIAWRRLHRQGDAPRTPRGTRIALGRSRIRGRHRRLYPLRIRPLALPLPRRQRDGLLMSYTADDRARLGLRESATFDRSTIAAIHRAAETGIYDIRGWGAKRRTAPFRRPAVPRSVDVALSAGGLPRTVRHRRRARRPLRQSAAAPRYPGHHRGHVLRCAVRSRERGAGSRRQRGRHIHDDRRRRHDPRGADTEQAPRLPISSVAIRDESR